MDRGTYSAASAGIMQLTKLELINNNLANIKTPGFKGQYLITETQEFEDTLASKMNEAMPFARQDHERTPGIQQISSTTDFSAGPIENTGNDLHVALREPNQFFVVNGPEGELYTRAGNFSLDVRGNLVTQDGFPVAGNGGALTVENGKGTITGGGFVRVNGLPVGRLQVVEFDDTSALERIGGNRFKVNGAAAPQVVEEFSVVPRSIELSNVSATQAMVDLITASRGFELYTKSAQSIDQMNEYAISRVGKRSA